MDGACVFDENRLRQRSRWQAKATPFAPRKDECRFFFFLLYVMVLHLPTDRTVGCDLTLKVLGLSTMVPSYEQ